MDVVAVARRRIHKMQALYWRMKYNSISRFLAEEAQAEPQRNTSEAVDAVARLRACIQVSSKGFILIYSIEK